MKMSIQLHVPDLKVKLVPATKIIKNMKDQFNDFKTNIDRRYALYAIFGGIRKEFGYTVEKLAGSNQVIMSKAEHKLLRALSANQPDLLEGKSVVLYDSEDEGELADPTKFEQFVLKELRRILRKARRMKNVSR